MTILDDIKRDREAETPQIWTAEKTNCRDLNEDGWALVWDKTPGGRKNEDGTTSFAMRFPMLLASGWLGEVEDGMAQLADALNLAERADRLIPAAEAMADALEAISHGDDSTDGMQSDIANAALKAWKEATT